MGFKTIDEVAAANAAKGHHWFDEGAMAFFKTEIEHELGMIGGRYFITSDVSPSGWKRWSVRRAGDDGSVDTVGPFHRLDRRTAIRFAHSCVALGEAKAILELEKEVTR